MLDSTWHGLGLAYNDITEMYGPIDHGLLRLGQAIQNHLL